MKRKGLQRSLAWLLTAAMLLTNVDVTAFAGTPEGGNPAGKNTEAQSLSLIHI